MYVGKYPYMEHLGLVKLRSFSPKIQGDKTYLSYLKATVAGGPTYNRATQKRRSHCVTVGPPSKFLFLSQLPSQERWRGTVPGTEKNSCMVVMLYATMWTTTAKHGTHIPAIKAAWVFWGMSCSLTDIGSTELPTPRYTNSSGCIHSQTVSKNCRSHFKVWGFSCSWHAMKNGPPWPGANHLLLDPVCHVVDHEVEDHIDTDWPSTLPVEWKREHLLIPPSQINLTKGFVHGKNSWGWTRIPGLDMFYDFTIKTPIPTSSAPTSYKWS